MNRLYRNSVLFGLLPILMACPGRDGPPPERVDSQSPRIVGLAAFAGEMLRRGAGERTTEEIAEQIEEVGGDLSISTDTDYTSIEIRVLREHLGLAMELLTDLTRQPTFPAEEIERLRRRELDRLALMHSNPRWLVRQAFYLHLYGRDHPYGQTDAEPASIRALTREHLVAFHRENFVPRNAFLVTVGDVDAEALAGLAERHFGGWEDRPVPSRELPPPPVRDSREIIVINVPGSTQAQISLGNVALRRSDSDYLRLRVANQVLGGSASARLFMNLRERCSYSYGIYSRISSRLGPAPISVGGAVESQHTAGALREIFSELDRVLTELPPENELEAAQDYMVGHFPIITETAGNLAQLVTLQRVLALPEDYWSTYRSNVAAVTGDQALATAQQYLRPNHALVVIVGDASIVAEPARRWGPVTVMNIEGELLQRLDAAPGQWPGGEPESCPEPTVREEQSRTEQPPAPSIARDLDFPDVDERALPNGLEVLTIERHQLPLVYLRLVIRAGSATDPL